MDVTGSDHKPVKGIFSLSIAHVDEITRRQKFGEILDSSSLKEEFDSIPETSFSSSDITLQGYDITVLRVTNKCRRNIAIFQLSVQTQASLNESEQISGLYSRCSFGFPDWLEVSYFFLCAVECTSRFVGFSDIICDLSGHICCHHVNIRILINLY